MKIHMKIYVVTFETATEHSLVVGAYSSIEKAIDDVATWTDGAGLGFKAPGKDAWSRQGSYVDDWENVVAQAEVKDAANQHALIYEMELDPVQKQDLTP